MENNLDFASNGVSAPHTYTNTTLQGNSDLDYQPISSRPTPPSSPAAASNDTKDQAARLRALLSSHLSEGGAGNGQATGADRLEALIDMLYAMTAPVVPEEKPAAAPVAAAYTVTLPEPVKDTPILETQNVEATLSPASVEAPVAQSVETVSAPVSEEAQNSALPSALAPVAEMTESPPSVVAEAQSAPHFTEPESKGADSLEAPQIEAPHAEAHQTETPQPESPQEQAQLLETIPTTAETTAEPTMLGETFPVQEPQAAQEAPAFIEDSIEDFTEDAPAVFAVGEAMTDDAQVHTRVPAMTAEVLTMDERAALLNPLKEEILKEECAVSAGNITFNFVTDKSTATLNIPMQANLSQITFEQRLDEIIFKIHLSL